MDSLTTGCLTASGTAFGVWAGVTFTARFRRWILESYARRVDLAIPEDLAFRLSQRATVLQRATALGGLAGTVVAAAVIAAFIPPPDFTRDAPPFDPASIVLVVSVLSGSMLARSFAAVVQTLSRRPGRRIARSSTPRLADYVSQVEIAASWVATGAALLLLILMWFAQGHGVMKNVVIENEGVFDSIGAFFAYLAVASLVVGGILSQIVLRAPQRAGSTQELAWDDAFRALTLRWVVGVPYGWASQSVLLSFIYVLIGSTWQPRALVIVVGLAAAAAWAGYFLLLYFLRNSVTDRHFRRRLWSSKIPVATR